MKHHSLIVLLAVCVLCLGGQSNLAVDFVVPADSRTQDGDTYSVPPVFRWSTIRYQQVYAASEFTSLTNYGNGWVIDIMFRGDATNGTSVGVNLPSLQLNLSTTSRGVDQLSPVFADNVGADDRVVFAGGLQTSIIGGTGTDPETFSFWIHLTNLFFYDPTVGNLLLDLRLYRGNTNTNIEARLDAWNRTNDSVSRVWRGDVNASTGLVETIGLPTQLFFWPNPKLTVQEDTNSVVLTWPANPPSLAQLQTILQTSVNLAPPTQWEAVTNGIVTSNLVNTYTIPLGSAGAAAYFRLVSTTPP